MKKIVSSFVVLLLGVLLVACGKKDDRKYIVVMTPNATHGFTGQSVSDAQSGTKKLAEEKDLRYKVLTSANATEQANQIEQVVAEKPDVVVLWPHDGTLKSAAQQLIDAKIPVIIYDRLLDNFDQVSEVMGDNEEIGRQTGNYFNNYFKDQATVNYIEFKGDLSSVPQQRSDGFNSTIADKFNLLTEPYNTGWQRATAQTQMEDFMKTAHFKNLDAIFTHDAEVALGVLAALEEAENHKVKLVSAVSEPNQLLNMIEHYDDLNIDIVTYTFNPNMVVEAVRAAIDHLEGKTLADQILIPTIAVDKSNFKSIVGWGA